MKTFIMINVIVLSCCDLIQGSNPVLDQINIIKNHLSGVFKRYKVQMEELQDSIKISSFDFHNWRDEMETRLKHIEENEITKLQDGRVTRAENLQDFNFMGFKDTVERLEELSKLTNARTCHQLKKMGIQTSGEYFIDPDGPGEQNSPPVRVYCDMKTGATRIEHNQGEQEVHGCKEQGCFVRAIHYKIPMKQIVSILSLSSQCEQFIRYDCLSAPLNSDGEANAWWLDRNSVPHFYWSGDASVEQKYGLQGTCYCHLQESCLSENQRCNCDSGEEIWTEDSGHITEKTHLPVTKLNFGNFYKENQTAKFYLGPLICSGGRTLPLEMDSCQSLWIAGTTNSGYHMIKTRSDSFPKVVYCDMSKLPGEPGFQRNLSSPGNLRDFVAFDAYLDTDIHDHYRYIGFKDTFLNIGNGLKVEDGIFQAPVQGTYMFSVHALPIPGKNLNIQIQRNNRPIGSFSNGGNGTSMVGQSIILQLVEGEEIRLFNAGGEFSGEIYNQDIYFHFVGVLLDSTMHN